MSYPWGTERRFNAYSDYFRRQFGTRVQKITIDAGFTCPNRDGLRGTGGCTFCNNQAFTPRYNRPGIPIREQIARGMEFHRTRYRKATSYLAYFQSYSNTYAELETLQGLYEEALKVNGIIGIVVGTRPDCVDAAKLDYLAELGKQTYVVVEYGIESMFDHTLERVNRGHNVETSAWAVRETARRGIRVGGHLIVGLPGEGKADFLETVDRISRWPLNSIKFHQLQLIRGTVMEQEYHNHPGDFHLFAMEDYLDFMVDYIERLHPSIAIERIAGETPPRFAVTRPWGHRYDVVLRHFEYLLESRDTWQGKHYRPS